MRQVGMKTNWFCLVMVAVLFAACDTDESRPRPSNASREDRTEEADSRDRERCDEEVPFGTTYLPESFNNEPIPGRAPGSRPPDDKKQVIFHLSGGKGRAIEVRRPGTPFTELALGRKAPTIRVLGRDTPNFGPVEPGGNEFIVFFTHPFHTAKKDECATYSLNEVGVSLVELKKTAEGLQKAE